MDYRHLPDGQEAHWEVVERILFLYAKLNPGQSYVQGMNEIIGPIYYTFATDPDRGGYFWMRPYGVRPSVRLYVPPLTIQRKTAIQGW